MKFNPKARLDTSQVQDRRGSGGGRGVRRVRRSRRWRDQRRQRRTRGGGRRPRDPGPRRDLSVQRLQRAAAARPVPACSAARPGNQVWTTPSSIRPVQTGADAASNEDCAAVAFINSVQGYWTDAFAPVRQHLRRARTRSSISGQTSTGVRAGLVRDGPVLLPGGPAGVHRPVVLGRVAHDVRRQRRAVHAGVRDRA